MGRSELQMVSRSEEMSDASLVARWNEAGFVFTDPHHRPLAAPDAAHRQTWSTSIRGRTALSAPLWGNHGRLVLLGNKDVLLLQRASSWSLISPLSTAEPVAYIPAGQFDTHPLPASCQRSGGWVATWLAGRVLVTGGQSDSGNGGTVVMRYGEQVGLAAGVIDPDGLLPKYHHYAPAARS